MKLFSNNNNYFQSVKKSLKNRNSFSYNSLITANINASTKNTKFFSSLSLLSLSLSHSLFSLSLSHSLSHTLSHSLSISPLSLSLCTRFLACVFLFNSVWQNTFRCQSTMLQRPREVKPTRSGNILFALLSKRKVTHTPRGAISSSSSSCCYAHTARSGSLSLAACCCPSALSFPFSLWLCACSTCVCIHTKVAQDIYKQQSFQLSCERAPYCLTSV